LYAYQFPNAGKTAITASSQKVSYRPKRSLGLSQKQELDRKRKKYHSGKSE